MRAMVIIPISAVLAGAVAYSAIRAYRLGETMSVREAELRWGYETFSADGFKNGLPLERARMVVDIVKKKTFVGKPVKDVFEALGWSDGHFFSDMVPAYIIEKGNKELRKDTWQIVFLLTRDSQNISEVIIHKNCCSKEVWESMEK